MKKRKPTQTGGICRPYFLLPLLTIFMVLTAALSSFSCTVPTADKALTPQPSEITAILTVTASVPPLKDPISDPPSIGPVSPSAPNHAIASTATASNPTETAFHGSASASAVPTPSPVPDFGYDDAIGWIRIDGTNIDYPVMYGKDYYYHSHSESGERSESGSIYSYYNALCRNNVIAGHNARISKTRFHQLHTLQDRILSEAEGGTATQPYIVYCSLFSLENWRIFAMYETKADEPTSTLRYNIHSNCSNETSNWIQTQIDRSEVDFGIVPSKQDRFLTLETCGDNYDSADAQSRLYFFLYCIDG